MYASLLAAGTLFSYAAPPAVWPPSLEGVILVEGKVVKAGDSPGAGQLIPVTVEIVRRYCGPADLVGKTFTDYNPAARFPPAPLPGKHRDTTDIRGQAAVPPLQVGETGIWVLRDVDGGLTPTRNNDLPLNFRVRKSRDARFREMSELAETIQRITAAGEDKRLGLLRKAALDKTPEVCSWAIRTAGKLSAEEGGLMLAELTADKKLCTSAEVALDDVLADRKPEEWAASPVRVARLRGWVEGSPDAFVAVEVMTRLDSASQDRECVLDEKLFLGLLRTCIANKKMPFESEDFRRSIEWLVQISAARVRSQDLALRFLLDQVQSAEPRGIRFAAAVGLYNITPLDAGQIAAIRAVQRRLSDKDLIAEIDKSIAEAANKPAPAVPRLPAGDDRPPK